MHPDMVSVKSLSCWGHTGDFEEWVTETGVGGGVVVVDRDGGGGHVCVCGVCGGRGGGGAQRLGREFVL